MKSDPIFSIIIPLFDSVGFIDRTLSSIITQNLKEFEVIIVNDGSTDGGDKICEEYCKNDFRFKLFNQKNSGVSHSRNRGIKESRGKYILFIDSDDFIEENFLQQLIEDQSNHPDSFIVQDFFRVDLEGKKVELYNFFNQEFSIHDFIYQFDITKFGHIAAKVYSRSIINVNEIFFPEQVNLSEDNIFFLNYLRCCEKVYLSSKKGYNYREVKNSAISKKVSMEEIFELYNQFISSINLIVSEKGIPVNVKEKVKFWTKAIIDNIYNLKLDEKQRIENLKIIRAQYYSEVIHMFRKSKFRGQLLKLSFQLGLLIIFDRLFQRFER